MSSFADVQDIIAGRHGVPASGRRALLSRLRHLNSADFPPGTRVGKWKRAEYRIDDLFAFALWFALAEAFVPPTVAQRLIRDLWPELVRGMLTAAAGDPRVGELPSNGSGGAVALISPYALDFVDGGPRGTGRGAVGAGSWELRMADNVVAIPQSRGAVIVIDLVREVEAIIGPRGSDQPVRADHVDELRAVAAEQGWARPTERVLPSSLAKAETASSEPRDPDPAGDRLGVADHFFIRAIDLLRSREAGGDKWIPGLRDLRHLGYVETPFQREGWKRFLGVGGVPFLWALWTALDGECWSAPLPETVKIAIAGRFPEGGLIDALIDTATDARDKAPGGDFA